MRDSLYCPCIFFLFLFRKHFIVAPSLRIFPDRKSTLLENLPHNPAQLLKLVFCRYINIFFSKWTIIPPMIDGSILTSNFSICFLLRKLFSTVFNSESVAASKGDAVVTKQGTSPRCTHHGRKGGNYSRGIIQVTIFSKQTDQVRCEGRKPLLWSCHLGFSL